jgi:small-conductance mechanosensitive channel
LLAHLEEGKSRAAVLSELHAQIQDAFNEYGTQIMSPHFESQPEKPVLVRKSQWYAPPATPPAATGDGDEPGFRSWTWHKEREATFPQRIQ